MKASAALELLHTMALVHDDLMDGTPERRGVPTTMPRFSDEARARGLGTGDPEAFGESGALLVGDLAAVLADRLMLESGFPAAALARGLAPYHEMRTDMAIGQFLDLALVTVDPAALAADRRAEGRRPTPSRVRSSSDRRSPAAPRSSRPGCAGSAHRSARPSSCGTTSWTADGRHGATAKDVNALVDEAIGALDAEVLEPRAVDALRSMAGLVAVR